MEAPMPTARRAPFPAADPNPGPGPAIEVGRMTTADRRRLSGPGLRAFRAIADLWGLDEQARIRTLGCGSRSTYHGWMQKARTGASVTLPLDTLLRISAVLGIHKALAILFPKPAEAMDWLKGPHKGPLFGGLSPLDLVTSGSPDAIRDTRRYLDARRGGPIAPPVPGLTIEPVTEADIVLA
jgi:hypothetical protein